MSKFMSSRERPKTSVERRFGIDSPEVPISYSIPFSWGNVVVSESADQALGLVNLNPDMVQGTADFSKSPINGDPRVDIWLLGSQEIKDFMNVIKLPPGGSPGILTTTRGHKEGVAIFMGHTEDKELLKESLPGMKHLLYGNMSDGIDENGLEISDEELNSQFEHALIHIIPRISYASLQEELQKWMWEKVNKKQLREARVAVASGILVTSAAVAFAENHDGAISAAAQAIIGVGIWSHYVGKKIKYIVRSRHLLQRQINDASNIYTARVLQAFHDSYCTRDKDAIRRQLYGDLKEPGEFTEDD